MHSLLNRASKAPTLATPAARQTAALFISKAGELHIVSAANDIRVTEDYRKAVEGETSLADADGMVQVYKGPAVPKFSTSEKRSGELTGFHVEQSVEPGQRIEVRVTDTTGDYLIPCVVSSAHVRLELKRVGTPIAAKFDTAGNVIVPEPVAVEKAA